MLTIRGSAVLALFLLAPTASASTWVVDDDGGPGVDFTTIAAAISASAPGDVILVRPGSYTGFTLSIGLSILGDTGVGVTGDIRVINVPAGPRVTLAKLSTLAIEVRQCAASVTLEELVCHTTDSGLAAAGLTSTITIANSADVRLRHVDVQPTHGGPNSALSVIGSRAEVTHSTLKGSDGRSHDIYFFVGDPQDGGDGIAVSAGGEVHVSSSEVRGGSGGNLPSTHLCFCPTAGDGGVGIRLGPGTEALVTGPGTALVHGGYQGTGSSCNDDGQSGNGIIVHASATLRVSGASIVGAPSIYSCTGPAAAIVGPHVLASPSDPTLTVAGTTLQGNPVTFTVHGEPGQTARLSLGRQLTVVDVAGVFEDRLTTPLRTYQLGVLPASGEAAFTITLPGGLPKGRVIVAQASTFSAGVRVGLTQSVPITLR